MLESQGSHNYSALENVPDDRQREMRNEIFDRVISKFKTPYGVVEGHYLIARTNGTIMFALDDPWARKVDAFFHLVVDPETLLERINSQSTSKERRLGYFERGLTALDAIKKRQDDSLRMVEERARLWNKPFVIIDNDRNPTKVVAEIYRLLLDMKKG